MNEDSLLASAEPSAAPAPEGNPDEPTSEAGWNWNEDLPGSGDTPDWFKGDKYKSVADQAKAYGELEGKFGAFTGAPDEYEVPEPSAFADSVELPEGVDFNLDKNDPLLKSFSDAAKDMGINQDGFNKLVGIYVQQQANDYADTLSNSTEQKEMLGENADSRLTNINQWAKANLDQEGYDALVRTATTADAVIAIETLISKTRNASLPDPKSITPAPGISKAEVDEMMAAKDENGNLKYVTDPHYRAKVEGKFKSLYGEEPYKQVMG